jgi:uncharacterized membrane protein YoaK (UPF0700 family)
MKAVDPVAVRDVLLLSLAAGSADAAGFIGLGHVFTSNMTGNTVLLGIAIGQGHIAAAARSLYVIVVFMLGAALAARIGRDVADEDWPRIATRLIGLEKIVLLLFAIGWTFLPRGTEAWDDGLLALLALAMALQSVAWTRLRAPGVGTTAITSTITALAMGIASLALPGTGEASSARVGFHAGVVALYCLGAATSGLLIAHLVCLAGWVPITAALFVTSGKKFRAEI